ncbi:TetR/AcrR family transcriptional regulator [Niallia sp. XMNu-256]|uniref:TetR/AcrR family transcriptional regulator n=1 Tax=Niallia sp. XMNu-256 TaxID=3082444 RepID=UPI0030CC7A80
MITDDKIQDTKEQILNTALQLFAERGYHKTKVSDIVKAVGVAQGTFYWHFKSKEMIALEVIKNGQEKLLQFIAQGYRQEDGTVEDAVAASKKLFEDFFTFSKNNKALMILLFKGIETEESVHNAILETRQKLEEAFQQNINRARELGILPKIDPNLKSALLMSLIEGMLMRWLFSSASIHHHLKHKSAKELAQDVVTFEFFGLLGKGDN